MESKFVNPINILLYVCACVCVCACACVLIKKKQEMIVCSLQVQGPLTGTLYCSSFLVAKGI